MASNFNSFNYPNPSDFSNLNVPNLLLWIESLEENNSYTQCKKMLRSSDNGFCCLGVGCDVMMKKQLNLNSSSPPLPHNNNNNNNNNNSPSSSTSYPSTSSSTSYLSSSIPVSLSSSLSFKWEKFENLFDYSFITIDNNDEKQLSKSQFIPPDEFFKWLGIKLTDQTSKKFIIGILPDLNDKLDYDFKQIASEIRQFFNVKKKTS